MNISWQTLDGYAYCPIAVIPKLIKKFRTYACQMIVVAAGWPGMNWFLDLIDLSTKPPLLLPHWETLCKQPFSERFHQNLQYLNLHVWHLDSKPNHLKKSVAERIKTPQRFSSRWVCESRWTILQSWCEENKADFKQPFLSSIEDFFTYLFNENNLKPTTIAGYRTVIADHLGPAGIDISHSFELNRLISSFHRDRPVKDRSISSWDLSLVL